MINYTHVLILLASLAVCELVAQVAILIYTRKNRRTRLQLAQEKPVVRSALSLLWWFVFVQGFGVLAFTLIAMVRNYYTVETLTELAPAWIQYMVPLQYVVFFFMIILPAATLLFFVRTLEDLDEERKRQHSRRMAELHRQAIRNQKRGGHPTT